MPTTLPVANPDTFDVFNSETLVRSSWEGVLANDTFGASSYLTVTEVNGQSTNVGTPVVLASGGTLQPQADGAFTYTPASNFVGVDSFTYTISDGTSSAPTTVDVAGIVITLAPIADQELFEGDAVSLQVSASASSGPGLTFSYYSGNLPNGLALDPYTGLISGTLTHDSADTLTTNVYAMLSNGSMAMGYGPINLFINNGKAKMNTRTIEFAAGINGSGTVDQ